MKTSNLRNGTRVQNSKKMRATIRNVKGHLVIHGDGTFLMSPYLFVQDFKKPLTVIGQGHITLAKNLPAVQL